MSAAPELDVLRAELQEKGLHRAELLDDPLAQFDAWFEFAKSVNTHEPHAMVLSSVGADGMPSSRHVLLKGLDHGFVFFTNYASQKGRELTGHPQASICFPWNILSRQVRVVGTVEKLATLRKSPRRKVMSTSVRDHAAVRLGRGHLSKVK